MIESKTKTTSEISTIFSEEQLEQIRKILFASSSSSTSLMAKKWYHYDCVWWSYGKM